MTGFAATATRPLQGPDFADLLDLVGDDPEFLNEIIDLFDRDSARLVEEILVATSRLDRQALGRSAHALKGVLSYFGETAAIVHCRRLEALASGQSTIGEESAALASFLADEVAQLRRDLTRLAPRSG